MTARVLKHLTSMIIGTIGSDLAVVQGALILSFIDFTNNKDQ